MSPEEASPQSALLACPWQNRSSIPCVVSLRQTETCTRVPADSPVYYPPAQTPVESSRIRSPARPATHKSFASPGTVPRAQTQFLRHAPPRGRSPPEWLGRRRSLRRRAQENCPASDKPHSDLQTATDNTTSAAHASPRK